MSSNDKLKVKKPWQIIPIWTNRSDLPDEFLKVFDMYKTNFLIFLDKEKLSVVKKLIYEMENNYLYFLFLKSKNITMNVFEKNKPSV